MFIVHFLWEKGGNFVFNEDTFLPTVKITVMKCFLATQKHIEKSLDISADC